MKRCKNEITLHKDGFYVLTVQKHDGRTFNFMFDTEYFEIVSLLQWRVSATGYAINRHSNYLHQIIFGNKPNGLHVDHRDGNKLDNRKHNLRACTHFENMQNKSLAKNSTTGLKGVSKTKNGKYKSVLRFNNTYIYLGLYSTKESAATAYNNAALKHCGEFARLNKL